MRASWSMVASAIVACLGTTQAGAQDAAGANAVLMDADGNRVGNVALTQLEQGVQVFAQAEGLEPGVHAFHIHETGSCEPPDFQSAGGHYNPGDHQHGWANPEGPHAGDLPNVHVQDDGRLAVEYFTDAVTLEEGQDTTVFDDDGSAVVVHASADDYQTDPAGDAGDRIACGVIEAAQ